MSAVASYQAILQRLNTMVGAAPTRSGGSASAASIPSWLTPPPRPAAPLGHDHFVRTSGLSYAPPLRRPPSDPNAYFVTQFYHPRWNPQGPEGSTNCGPASLTMALKAFGLTPPGVSDPRNVEGFIDKTRWAMMGTENDLQLSSDDDVLRGALASGAQAQKVYGLANVERAIAEGKLVVLAGNPAAYGHRFREDQLTSFNGGHFITVTHMVGDRVWINDPLSKAGSLEITRDELRRYMAHENWNVGVAVWA
jgi:hypothetical protein